MLLGFSLHAATIHKVEKPPQALLPWFPSNENVCRYALVRGKVKFLIDDGDTQLLGMIRILDLCFLAVQKDATPILVVCAAQNLHESRLASAVLADQRYHLTGLCFKIHVIQRLHAREGLGDAFHTQYRLLLVQ